MVICLCKPLEDDCTNQKVVVVYVTKWKNINTLISAYLLVAMLMAAQVQLVIPCCVVDSSNVLEKSAAIFRSKNISNCLSDDASSHLQSHCHTHMKLESYMLLITLN